MAEEKKKKDYFEVRFPKLPFKNLTFSHFLTLLLIIFSFLLGAMTVKLQSVLNEKNTQSVQPGTQTGATEQEPVVNLDVDPGNLPVLGNQNAKVTIVEFSDFQCPFCKRFYDDAMKQIKKDYIDTGKAKLTYRHYPLSFHQNAKKAAEASECANEQGKFWEYHDILFEKQGEWSEDEAQAAADAFVSYAGELELDTGTFSSCLTSGKFAQKIAEDEQDATLATVDATPTFFINGRMLVGALPYEEFKKVIDEQLNK